jgi:predicted Zn-dependent peptidase
MEGLAVDHPDRFALALIDTILGGGMSSRLFQDVRERRGLVYSIYSFHSQFLETGVMGVYAGTTPAQTEKVLDLISKEIYDIADKGALEKEITRAKDHIKGSMLLGFEDNTTRMTRLGKAATYETELLSIDQLVERVEAVSGDEIKRVAADVLSRPKVLTIISPESKVSIKGFDDIREGV